MRVCKVNPGGESMIVTTRQKVWDATYRGIYPDEMIDNFDLEWHLKMESRRLSNPNYHCYAVMDQENCVGYLAFGAVRPGTWKDFSFRLHSLYLLPQYQGQGLGKKLFLIAADACKNAGFDKMYLDCHPQNHKALAFYTHMGGVVMDIDAGHEHPQEDTCTIEYYFA